MRLWLLAGFWFALTAPCVAQNGSPVTTKVGGREIVARDFVGPGQFDIRSGGVIEVPAYELKVDTPPGARIEIGDTGGRVHGLAITLKGDPKIPGSGGFMAIWADLNSSSVPDALGEMRSPRTLCGAIKAEWAETEWALAIDGLKTASCRVDGPGDRVQVVLLAMGGVQPDGKPEPRFSYRATLGTTLKRYEADLKRFKSFVCSIDVTKDGSRSSLC